MKLVYVLNHYSKDESSHFVHVFALIGALARRGVEIVLVIEKAVDLPAIAHVNVEVVGLSEPCALRRWLRLRREIRRAIRRGYRTVFVRIAVPAALAAVVAGLGTGARVCYWQSGTVHALDRAANRGARRIAWLIRSWLPFRLVIAGVDRFATGPESMVRYYRDEVGVPARKLVNLYNDIDVDGFRSRVALHPRDAERARLGADQHTPVILFVHRLSPVRRTMTYIAPLLAALASPVGRRWLLVLAGGGPEQEALAAEVARAGVGGQCRVLGEVPGHALPALYGAADLFINPSYAEGFPRVILEALAAGLPIVTTDAGGTAELLGTQQQRFVTPRDDPGRFVDAVTTLLDDRGLRQELASENRAAVRRFDTTVVAAMYQKALFG